MIVRCGKCGTEFGFDDRQVGEGVTVRCSMCKHVFKVESPTAARQGWAIRTTDGMTFTAADVTTLREWIDEGRLHPDDQVSRSGRNWVRLGDMPEFAQAFQGFENVAPLVKPVEPVKPVAEARPPQAVARVALERRPVPRPPSAPQSRAPSAGPSSPAAARPAPTPAPSQPDDVHEDAPTAVVPRGGPSGRAASPRAPASSPPPSAPQPAAPEVGPQVDEDEDELDFEVVPRKKGVGFGVIALLGVLVGVAVMFLVPDIRNSLLSLGTNRDGAGQVANRPELAAADAALRSLGTAAVAKAEADLHRAIDSREADQATTDAMHLALAELLVSRAIAYQIAGAIDEQVRADFEGRAAEDSKDGNRELDAISGAPDAARLARVRALARVASGRPEAEILPLVPEDAVETQLIVRAALMWRDPSAAVPSGLVGGLNGLKQRGALGESALALGLLRAGDESGARAVAERLLVAASDQVVGQAVRAVLGEDPSAGEASAGETGEADEVDTDGGETGGETEEGEVAKPPPPPGPGESGGDGGGGGGLSFDRLVDRGCNRVAKGDASNGIKDLMRAFDREPNNVDVLVCIGQGYAAQGNGGRAAHFFDRALEQSPRHKTALVSAAKLAARSGAEVRAISLYERVLDIDPNHSAAKAYLAKHKSEPEPKPEEPASPQPTPTPAETSGE